MTLYCQTVEQLPEAMMSRLIAGAEYARANRRERGASGVMEQYTYRWNDFVVNVYARRGPDIAPHLQAFVKSASDIARRRRSVLDAAFVERVLSTRLVIGYDAGPDYDEPSRFERLEQIILTLCRNTESLLFWQGRVYDSELNLLLG